MKKDSKAIERLLALKARSQKRSYVKDGDLQIDTPASQEDNLENAKVFKNIYTHYMYEKDSKSPVKKDVKSEMEDAENSFQSMMELHKSIKDAYQTLVKK